MMLYSALSITPDWVSPPGDTILSILEERELTLEQFADQIGLTVSAAQKVLSGRNSIDSNLANRLAEFLGASKSFWLAREYDYRASVRTPSDVKIKTLSELLKQLPILDMQRFGWIKATQSKAEKTVECMSFFGVSSFAQWQEIYDSANLNATYKKSLVFSSNDVATTAWLRKGEIETANEEVSGWSPEVLKDKIPRIRRLTWYKNPDLFLPKLKFLLAEAGVNLAIVRAPKGCTASGAARISSKGNPHIQLSFRYLSDDQFWFTLFHELGHLILHYDNMPIFESSIVTEHEIEDEANDFAAQVIIPAHHHDELVSLRSSRFPIINFAKKVGVSPGLVVGQLQHRRIIGFNQMQHLKRRFQWID